MTWLLRSWFLISLVMILPGGMSWGWMTTEAWRQATVGQVRPAQTTMLILLLMSFNLDSSRLWDSFRSPLPVFWGTLVNIGIMPLMAWPLSRQFGLTDFSLGLMIAAVVPCTLATASVSTRQAGGNDAVSLLVTLLSNGISVVLTPLWLKWTISIDAQIDPRPVIANLALTVLLPTLAGQAGRYVPVLRRFADRFRSGIGIAVQILVLVIVLKAAVEAGGRLQSQPEWPAAWDMASVILACSGLHVVAMIVADRGARCLAMSRVDRIATVFAGSQKTLPIGLLLAEMPAITGGLSLPFVTFPILLFHACQLLLDTAVADRINRRSKS